LRNRGTLALTLGAVTALSGCGGARKPPAAIPRPDRVFPAVGTLEEGMASWYGPGYDGRRTSCGDRFDQDALTAAHPRWACGTLVRVTFRENGRSVVVRVNDLFPGHKGRVVDLSRGAARAIGLIGPGTGWVRLEVLETPPSP
jgi:rare lipoprotein A (peptidoglycan hydrolase)